MVEAKLIGVGAAGNKAAIEVLEAGVMSERDVYLFNTTEKDIPDKYKDNESLVHLIDNNNFYGGGSGKEHMRGRKAIVNAIKAGAIDLDAFVNNDSKMVIIVASTEGGTGSGAAPIIAKYYEANGYPVHVFALVGFQDEGRGIDNTLKFFSAFGESKLVTIHTILNDRFKDYTESYATAEEAANKEFANQVNILLCNELIPSKQNIDNTDHYKIISTSGYGVIKHIPLIDVKNIEASNKLIKDAFDNNTCMDYEEGYGKLVLAVIINASERTLDNIDDRYDVIKRYIGIPYEIFRHIQNDGSEEYMDVVIAGLPYPEKPISQLVALKEKIENAGNRRKSFADIIGDMGIDDDDSLDMTDFVRASKETAVEKFEKSIANKKIPFLTSDK